MEVSNKIIFYLIFIAKLCLSILLLNKVYIKNYFLLIM